MHFMLPELLALETHSQKCPDWQSLVQCLDDGESKPDTMCNQAVLYWLQNALTCILGALVMLSVSGVANIVRCDKSSEVSEVECLVIAEKLSRLQVQFMQSRLGFT